MKNILASSYKNLFGLLTAGLVAANVGYLTHNVFGGLVALVFFLLVPGYLIICRWKDAKLEGWVVFSLSFGLSLLLMMVGGLLLNSLHPIGIDRPLSPTNILVMLDIVTVGLLWRTRNDLRMRQVSGPTIKREHTLFVAALSMLPLLGALGAIRLNNGGSSAVTMIGLGSAATLFLLLFWRKHLKGLYPYAAFTIGLMVLLALSMRSWDVSGHDVRHEYYLFTQVLQQGFWNNRLSFPGDTYNACMSVTILPTAIAAVSHVPGVYVFKLLMQIIFALGLVPLYLLTKHLGGSRRALLASLLFIGFPTFVNDMPFLVRQEVAFVFFALLLLSAFLRLGRKLATYLVVAFMLGVILSHYSSGYVTLAILFMAWAFYRLIEKLSKTKTSFRTPLLSLPILAVALLFTFLWNAQVTATAGTLGNTIRSTVQGIFNGSSARSSGVHYSLVSGSAKPPAKVLAEYAGDKSNLVKLVPEQDMATTTLGKHIASAKVLHAFNSLFRAVSAKALQVLLLIGIAYFFISNRLLAKRRDVYFYALAVASVMMMALIAVLPQLSVDYGLTRLFLQAMIIIGLPIIVGLELLAGVVRRIKLSTMAVFVALFFLHLSGFVPQLLGGYPPQMALNNTGYYYDIYYYHKGEQLATELLNSGAYSGLHLSADKYAISRFQGDIKYGPITDPVTTTYEADYLYEDNANVQKDAYANYMEGNVMEYTFSDPAVKSLLYSNQASRISLRFNITIAKDN